MDYETANNTITSRFKTLIKDVESIQVHYDNQKDFIPPKQLWCRLTVQFGGAGQMSLGAPTSRLFRTTGVMIIQVFDIIGNGTKAIMELIDKINIAFRGVSINELTFRTPDITASMREGDYWQINISCPFEFEEIG